MTPHQELQRVFVGQRFYLRLTDSPDVSAAQADIECLPYDKPSVRPTQHDRDWGSLPHVQAPGAANALVFWHGADGGLVCQDVAGQDVLQRLHHEVALGGAGVR